jgi:hypothetical protein
VNDPDVRLALHAWLRAEHAEQLSETRIIDELGVASQIRVDTAVLNGAFAGFEIKSERDTLRRLPKQVQYYSAVLDYATLVVATNHLEHARAAVPKWWGIVEARSTDGEVRLRRRRSARRNARIDPFTLCTLLWREEALAELEHLGADRGVRSKPNFSLWERLSASAPPEYLRTAVRERLKVRSGWRVDAPPPPYAAKTPTRATAEGTRG